jgi:acyl-CoA thioesterase-1
MGAALGLCLGSTGCKADSASRASSEMDKSASPAGAAAQNAPSSPKAPLYPASNGPDRRPLVVCFGDSLTAGYGADEGASYPDFLQKDLDAAGYQYRVVNEGISGNTTKDGVDRLAEVIAMKPQVVVLEFGGNDGLRGLKTQTTKTNLGTMIAALKKSGAKVVVAGITLPPDYGPDYVKAFTGNYAALGHQYEVPVLPFILQNVYGVPGMMQADNIHATDQGNQIVAKNVLALVEPLLKR